MEETGRFAGSLRRAKIETNPHQIDAVHFALERIPEGGCILADEVGLGKTIEAGLVLAQLVAEGKEKILVLVPLALAGQWQAELADLLGVESTVVTRQSWNGGANPFEKPGVYIVGREFAAGERTLASLRSAGPWDLVVVDEAHEQFSTIYRRFHGDDAASGQADLERGPARRAAKIRETLGRAPYLLLTATPLQNSLLELWGLVQYVDPEQSLLGPIEQFRTLYTADSAGRTINEDRADELADRLQQIVHRTLRRQAQPFLQYPFTRRTALTVNFHMTPTERRIYDMVAEYLDGGGAAWMGPGARKLVLLGLRRRMGSSMAALIASLESLRKRVDEAIHGGGDFRVPSSWYDDFDDLDFEDTDDDPFGETTAVEPQKLVQESARLDDVLREAKRLKKDSKATAFLELIAKLLSDPSEKIVVFTESLSTQADLARRLDEAGFANQFTLFSGTNRGARADEALAVWDEEVGHFLTPAERPGRPVAIRRALIHEFKTRTRILIATEAGAKGLNLQFASKVVNYDLPWNPQRIEQRIGRCHRYRQEKDVLVVNFVNLDNEAESRVHELLDEKFRLFEWTFGASDELLGMLVASVDLEGEVRRILEASAGRGSIDQGFDDLSSKIDGLKKKQVEETWKRTKRLLSRLDSSVRSRLAGVADELSRNLAGHDRMLADLVEAWVSHWNGKVERRRSGENLVLRLEVDKSALPPAINGCRTFHVGPPDPGRDKGEHLSLEHPLLGAIRADAMGCVDPGRVEKVVFEAKAVTETLGCGEISRPGTTGSWETYRVTLHGLEIQERLVQVAAVRTGSGWQSLPLHVADRLGDLVPRPDRGTAAANDPPAALLEETLGGAIEEAKKEVRAGQEARVRRLLARSERQEADAQTYLEKRLENLRAELEGEARREIDATTVEELEDAMNRRRKLESQIEQLETRSRTERVTRRDTATNRRRDLLRRRLVTDVEIERIFRASFRVGD